MRKDGLISDKSLPETVLGFWSKFLGSSLVLTLVALGGYLTGHLVAAIAILGFVPESLATAVIASIAILAFAAVIVVTGLVLVIFTGATITYKIIERGKKDGIK